MVIRGSDVVNYVRWMLRDTLVQTRAGSLYSDSIILSQYNHWLRQCAIAIARLGYYHHIAGLLEEVVYTLPLTPTLPTPASAYYGISFTIEGRDIPVYNGAISTLWGEQYLPDTNRYFAVLNTSTNELRLFLPVGVGPQTGVAVFLYLSNNSTLSSTSDVIYGCSRTFYIWVAERTVLHLLQRDAGMLIGENDIPGGAIESTLSKIQLLLNEIIRPNGVVIPPYEVVQ